MIKNKTKVKISGTEETGKVLSYIKEINKYLVVIDSTGIAMPFFEEQLEILS